MTCPSITAWLFLTAAPLALCQTRADLAARFGPPQSEVFLLPQNLKLTATYGPEGALCAFRIETPEHSERAAPNLTDSKFWFNSEEMTRLIVELVPPATRQGTVKSSVAGLRVGEHMRTEIDDTVEITRIQRSRILSVESDSGADRLVRIRFKRAGCYAGAQ